MDRLQAEKYLAYCFYLAEQGSGSVSPNPKVGAVLVYDGRIIGEGYHQQFGKAHAEVRAIESVKPENVHLISKASLIVSLEPCNHFGKTGPCTDLILKNKIPELVFSNYDPNPLMAGKSIKLLEQAGVKISGPFMEPTGQQVIREYVCNVTNQRPYVILKFAQSADYFLGQNNIQTKISSFASDLCVHRWRSEVDAILVGKNTVEIDNPSLTTRLWSGKNPVRVVLARIAKDQRSKWNVFNKEASTFDLNDLGLNNSYSVEELLSKLFNLNLGIVMVEGGAQIIRFFYESGIWDEARVITNSELKIKDGIAAPSVQGHLIKSITLNKDIIHYIAKNKPY